MQRGAVDHTAARLRGGLVGITVRAFPYEYGNPSAGDGMTQSAHLLNFPEGWVMVAPSRFITADGLFEQHFVAVQVLAKKQSAAAALGIRVDAVLSGTPRNFTGFTFVDNIERMFPDGGGWENQLRYLLTIKH